VPCDVGNVVSSNDTFGKPTMKAKQYKEKE
jgi:hypothetical protein